MALTLMTPPIEEPISLSEAKNYLRINHTVDDFLIQQLIVAARQMIEARLGVALIDQTWQQIICVGADARARLWRTPLQSIISVVEITPLGEVTLDPTVIKIVEAKRGVIETNRKPGSQLQVQFLAGFGDQAAVPEDLRQALRLLLAYHFQHRDQIGKEAGLPREYFTIMETYRERSV